VRTHYGPTSCWARALSGPTWYCDGLFGIVVAVAVQNAF